MTIVHVLCTIILHHDNTLTHTPKAMNSLQALEIRAIAMKYLNERDPELRTEYPLPADYEAFRNELRVEATDYEVIIRFEDEWEDIYEQMVRLDWR